MTTAILTPYLWARRNDVLVTLVREAGPDGFGATYLVQNALPGNRKLHDAFVMEFGDCEIKVNGEDVVFDGDWPEVLTELALAVGLAPSVRPGSAVTTRYEVE